MDWQWAEFLAVVVIRKAAARSIMLEQPTGLHIAYEKSNEFGVEQEKLDLNQRFIGVSLQSLSPEWPLEAGTVGPRFDFLLSHPH
jgi:hypothetical protein